MFTRPGTFLISSLAVHGVMFAALAATPPVEALSDEIRAIEFVTITEEGGGRLGDDEEIGDAVAPEKPPERLFRKVRPKPTSKPARVAVAARPEPEAEPPSDSGPSTNASEISDSSPTSHAMAMGSAGTDPTAVGSGTGGGEEGVDRRLALRAWLREVQREVNKIATRNYPSSAVRRRLEGRLRLGVTIGTDGTIVSVRVLSSSGHSVLDDSATASVHALRIPAPPEALRWRQREISLPIRYALD